MAPVRSVLQPQVKGLADLEPVELGTRAGGRARGRRQPARGCGVLRVDLVEKRGEFAVRGGIVDVFPPTEEHPLRLEFFGDEIDEIRAFAVADQRTLEPVERVSGRRRAGSCCSPMTYDDARPTSARRTRSGRDHRQARLRGWPSRAWSRSRPRWWRRWSSSSSCCHRRGHVLVLDPERVRTRAHDLVATSEEFLGAAGPPPRPEVRRRSTSAPHRCARLARSALRCSSRGRPGGGSARSGWMCRRREFRALETLASLAPQEPPRVADGCRAPGRGLPRGHRGSGHRRPRPPRSGQAGGHHPPGPRARPAHGRGARRARCGRRGWSRDSGFDSSPGVRASSW